MKSIRSDALIIPADAPISEVEVKKALLFFDSVTLPNPMDYALVNEGEIVEKFPPNYTVTWTARNSFPRNTEYEEDMFHLINETKNIQKNGLVRITSHQPMNYLNPGINWALWHSAITDFDLVKAATPDRFSSDKPTLDCAGYISGGAISLNGYPSKYEIKETRPVAILADVDESWSYYAHLRIGRFLKFLRLSHGLNLIPLVSDEPNQNMLMTASRTRDLFMESEKHNQNYVDFPKLALQMDIFDADELNKTLLDMSWKEVIRLRKEILPGVQSLHLDLMKATKLQRGLNINDIELYSKNLELLHKDYQDKREKLANELEKLRIGALCKFGGTVAITKLADMTGLIAVTTGAPMIDLLVKIFPAGLLATSAISSELANLIPAQRAVKRHSMYFIEKVPKK